MADSWSVTAAGRIGRHAGLLAVHTGQARTNPYTGRAGMDDLAEAWQHAYDRAVHPAGGDGA